MVGEGMEQKRVWCLLVWGLGFFRDSGTTRMLPQEQPLIAHPKGGSLAITETATYETPMYFQNPPTFSEFFHYRYICTNVCVSDAYSFSSWARRSSNRSILTLIFFRAVANSSTTPLGSSLSLVSLVLFVVFVVLVHSELGTLSDGSLTN